MRRTLAALPTLVICLSTVSVIAAQEGGEAAATSEAPRLLSVELVEIVLTGSDSDAAAELAEAGDLIRTLRAQQEAGRVRLQQRIVLSALEGNEAMAQFGKEISLVTGVTVMGGREIQNARQHSVGTLAQVTTRLDGDTALLQLTFESSRHEPGEDGSMLGTIVTTTINTTVSMKLGESVLVGGRQAEDQSLLVATVSPRRSRSASALPARRRPPRAGSFCPSPARPRSPDVNARILQYAQALIRKYDKNDDGKVDTDEADGTSLDKRFETHDTDRDGALTAEELASGLQSRVRSRN